MGLQSGGPPKSWDVRQRGRDTGGLHCVLRHVRQRPCSPAPRRIGTPGRGPHSRGRDSGSPVLMAPRSGPRATLPAGFPPVCSAAPWSVGGGIFIPLLSGVGGGICTRLGRGGAWYLHLPVSVGRHLHLKGEAAQAPADATPWLHGDSDGPGFLLASPGRSPCRTACGRAVWSGRLASSDVSLGEPWASSPLAPKLTLKHSGWPKAWVWPVSPPCSQLWPLGPWGAGARPAQQGTPWGGVGAPMGHGGAHRCGARGGWRGAPPAAPQVGGPRRAPLPPRRLCPASVASLPGHLSMPQHSPPQPPADWKLVMSAVQGPDGQPAERAASGRAGGPGAPEAPREQRPVPGLPQGQLPQTEVRLPGPRAGAPRASPQEQPAGPKSGPDRARG